MTIPPDESDLKVVSPGQDEELLMEIRGLMLDPSQNVPIVILREEGNNLFLPIWIGVAEASAIAQRIEGVSPPRPMTHDLLHDALELMAATVTRVVVNDLQQGTFYALIHIQHKGADLALDARPSDALALALRAEAPIYVLKSVLDKAQAVDLASQVDDEDRLKKWLEELNPEDLGKYTM